MGYMKLVSICTDCLSEIQANAEEFIDGISLDRDDYTGRHIRDVAVGFSANFVQVMRAHHADIPVLTMQFQNCLTDLGDIHDIECSKNNIYAMRAYYSRIQRAKDMLADTERNFIDMIVNTVYDKLYTSGALTIGVDKAEIEAQISNFEEIKDMNFSNATIKFIVNRVWKEIQALKYNQGV